MVLQVEAHILSQQHRPSSLTHFGNPPIIYDFAAVGFQTFDVSDVNKDNLSIRLTKRSPPGPILTNSTLNGSYKRIGLIFNLPHYSEKFREPEDVDSEIKYIRSLYDHPLSIPHHEITTSLINTLATRVKGDAGYALEDINEIVVLCRALLASDTSPDSLIGAFQALTGAVLDELYRSWQIQSLDHAIDCLREALKTYASGLRQVSLDLANLLAARFLILHINGDYQEAKAVLHDITVSRPPGDLSGSYHIQASSLIAAIGHARSIVDANLEDFEGTIYRCRSFLDHAHSFGDPLHPVITTLLAGHAELGHKHIALSQSARPGIAHLEVDSLPCSGQLSTFDVGAGGYNNVPAPLPMSFEEKINHLQRLYSSARPGTDHQRQCLKDLVCCYNAKVSSTYDTTYVEEAIKYNRGLIATTHPTDQSKFLHLSAFGYLLYVAFHRTEKVEYLDESITHLREVLKLDGARPIYFATIRGLLDSLSIRWQLFRRSHDLDDVMSLFASGVKDSYATVPSRFELACHWAHTGRIFRHPSVLIAYNSAMSLMQESLAFAPTLSNQHDLLLEKHDLYEKTPLNFASYHIRAGQVERAVEVLEQGRALLWSEMRGFRTSTDRLRAADPDLADRFTAINEELEMLTTSAPPNGSVGMNDGEFESDEWVAQFPVLMEKQQELLKERDFLISKIRGLPGLEKLLLPLSFDTLRSAASHGPVIIINHCKWRSDIIIVLHDSPPSLITTPYNFFGRANRLKDELLGTRQRYGPGSNQYVRALISVLKGLYELIGIPVIERLKELRIPEQSRIWWCPTSVFGYLPLHAMGPIPSAGKEMRYFSDIYISSYTPTLSALITSRKSGTRNSGQPSILLVAQPDPSLPGVSGEIPVIQSLDLPVTSLISQSATPSAVLDGLRHHQFCHFACHGTLTTGKPFEASIVLHKEEPLLLLDIVRSRLPAGECAFLATCHTAELSDGSMPDEVLHLSAAMQYSGFRSVIGTMWAMADEDGQYLAKYFYESMFSDENSKQGVPYYERSSRALAVAIRMLRGRGVRLERWVNYAHFGA